MKKFFAQKLFKALVLGSAFISFALIQTPGYAATPAQNVQKKTTKTSVKKKVTTQKKTVKPKTTAQKTVAKKKSDDEVSVTQRNALQSQQKSLQDQLGTLKKQLLQTEASRSEAADALAESEAAISQVNRRLRELKNERAKVENRLKELRQQELAVSGQLTDAEKQSQTISQAQYLNIRRNPWHELIAGTNPHDIARDSAALQYFAQAQSKAVDRLTYRQANIHSVSEETLSKRKELANIANKESKERAQLVKDQANRKKALENLKKQIATQRASIDKMERDQERLGKLVANIDKLLAQRKAEEQRRAAQEAARRKQQASQSKSKATASYQPPLKGSFAKQRGKLVMPALGKIVGRFGAARANASGKSTQWKGLMIQAKRGSDVLACASGQVVFSDWLRGFGNIIIIDHGDGFLSIYANNESLYKEVGDKINRGDTIASVGNTGGEDKPGLYFELRHNGKPFNPLPWIGKQ